MFWIFSVSDLDNEFAEIQTLIDWFFKNPFASAGLPLMKLIEYFPINLEAEEANFWLKWACWVHHRASLMKTYAKHLY